MLVEQDKESDNITAVMNSCTHGVIGQSVPIKLSLDKCAFCKEETDDLLKVTLSNVTLNWSLTYLICSIKCARNLKTKKQTFIDKVYFDEITSPKNGSSKFLLEASIHKI